jgi:hypothetical protein
MSDEAFTIMQIGNPALDEVYDEVIHPALSENGLVPRRADKDTKGGLLKSEIVSYLEAADIIIADLTNERPNCYLEVGYVMGLHKYLNLILTAREDHHPEHPDHDRAGPKVHFDLTGYDILFWNPQNLQGFKEELSSRIARRRLDRTQAATAHPANLDWVAELRREATTKLEAAGFHGHVEEIISLGEPKPSWPLNAVLDAAIHAQVHTFGWPIGIVDHPRVTSGAIAVEVDTGETFDLWRAYKNGDYYCLRSLFEDHRREKNTALFFDTRIIRTTEALLRAGRFYRHLGVEESKIISFSQSHRGLAGRRLTSATGHRLVHAFNPSLDEEVLTRLSVRLGDIEKSLVELVQQLTEPLFEIFDMFRPADDVYQQLVRDFEAGQIR